MIPKKSVTELAALMNKGELSSLEITDACLKAIEENNDSINAFITVAAEQARVAACEADERRARGDSLSPYDGIPIALKDNMNTSGVRTTCGSRILENFVPPFDATAYSKLKEQGFVLVGKANLDEFAMGSTTESSYFGATKNPHDLTKVAGGSSGGSAAAVAGEMIPVSLGSDTGGSIRQPAAFCGVVGVKPTYGRVSRYGLVAFASSLDQIGTFAHTVDDAALMLSVISGHDPVDSTSINREVDFAPSEQKEEGVKGMVIGVPEEYFEGVDTEIKEMVLEKIKDLEDEGARIEKISLKYTEYAIPVYYLIATAEASSNLARFDGVRYGHRSAEATDLQSLYLKSRSEGFGKEVKRRIILGTFSLSSGYYDAYYLKALKGRKLIIEDFKEAFSKVDAIISPATTSTAFGLGEMISDPLQMYMSDILTISANLAGIPGISVPVGNTKEGMPVGLQIMGSHFQEKTLFRVARTVEDLVKGE